MFKTIIFTLSVLLISTTGYSIEKQVRSKLRQVNVPYTFTTNAIEADAEDSFYLAGYGVQPVSQVGNLVNGYDSKIAKIDAVTGAIVWEKFYALSDSGNSDSIKYMKLMGNVIYVLADVNEGPLPPTNGTVINGAAYHMTMKLLKIDASNGDVIWSTTFTDTTIDNAGNERNANVFGAGISVSDAGEIGVMATTGTWNSVSDIMGRKQWYVSLVNSSGSILWNRQFAGDYDGYASPYAENVPSKFIFNANKAVIVGTLENTLTVKDLAVIELQLGNGESVSENVYSSMGAYSIDAPSNIAIKNGSLYIVAGAYNASGRFGGLILKASLANVSNLSILNFFQNIGTLSKFKTLEIAESGSIYIAGTYDPATTYSAIDAFVAKYSSSGVLLWTKYQTGSALNTDYGSGAFVDCTEKVYFTSNVQSSDTLYDIQVNELDKYGQTISSTIKDGVYHANDYVHLVMKTKKYHVVFAKGSEYSESPTTPYLLLTELKSCADPMVGVLNNVGHAEVGVARD